MSTKNTIRFDAFLTAARQDFAKILFGGKQLKSVLIHGVSETNRDRNRGAKKEIALARKEFKMLIAEKTPELKALVKEVKQSLTLTEKDELPNLTSEFNKLASEFFVEIKKTEKLIDKKL